MIKAIFIDIDGTLRNSKKEITNITKETIGFVKKAGIKVVICSGRARTYVERVSKECNASENIKKVVDEITLSNDEDGVAIFLDKLLKEIK